ncbi:MAG: hypothetical protein Q7T05_04400 [Dehalococcoidia bacterium]|nr:hypothetical protein [Dehalococcoidia bacterium]
MTLAELQAQISLGEDSRREFKRDVTNGDSLAAEMAAFANSEGGTSTWEWRTTVPCRG